jgi:hypothetical protein
VEADELQVARRRDLGQLNAAHRASQQPLWAIPVLRIDATQQSLGDRVSSSSAAYAVGTIAPSGVVTGRNRPAVAVALNASGPNCAS